MRKHATIMLYHQHGFDFFKYRDWHYVSPTCCVRDNNSFCEDNVSVFVMKGQNNGQGFFARASLDSPTLGLS